MRMVMVLAAMAAWTAAGQVFPPPPAGGAQGGAGGEAMPPAPGPLYGAVRAAGTVRRGDAVVWGDAQGRTITGADMGNSAWASTGMVAAAVSAAAAGMASTQQVAAAVAPLATTQQVAAAAAALTIHTNRADNPHGVTAAQVGAITNELDLVALAADRFLPIDAGKNVISTDAGSGSIVTYSTLIGDRAGNSITGANVVAIGRDAARDILNPAIAPEKISLYHSNRRKRSRTGRRHGGFFLQYRHRQLGV